MTLWTLSDAQWLAADLNSHLKPLGWAVGLTGGVLFNMTSEKDVDIILYRRGRPAPVDISVVRSKLEEYGFSLARNEFELKAGWLRNHGVRDPKHVEEWSLNGKRVDIFFLS